MPYNTEIRHKGANHLIAIITELIATGKTWDYCNGVLSCKAFGNLKLWYWWGDLLIAKPNQKKAGSMKILTAWKLKGDAFSFEGEKD